MVISIEHFVKVNIDPPKPLIPWLCHQTSLTKKLETCVGGTDLTLLEQGWYTPNWWDKFTLGITGKKVFRRKILMRGRELPCWFAQTIIPEQCYTTNSVFFERLAHESLGVIIFNEHNVKRVNLFHYAIDERCIEYYWLPQFVLAENKIFWLRFSEFKMTNGFPFYLIEILLPSLTSILNN